MEILDGVRAIIFDVDGTLYDKRAVQRRLAFRIAAAYWSRPVKGVRVVQGLQAYRQAHEDLRAQVFSPGLQLALAAKKSGYEVSELRGIVDEWFERAPLRLMSQCVYPKLPQLLRLLSERRIPCGVFSDYPAQAKLTAMGLEGFFSHVLCAAEVGRLKPDPSGILLLANQIGLTPKRTLYVGDRTIDLEAAARAGMRGLLIGGKTTYSMLLHRLLLLGDREGAAAQPASPRIHFPWR
jgi:HAD superfamily hydrolase (TIGR01549 family)